MYVGLAQQIFAIMIRTVSSSNQNIIFDFLKLLYIMNKVVLEESLKWKHHIL